MFLPVNRQDLLRVADPVRKSQHMHAFSRQHLFEVSLWKQEEAGSKCKVRGRFQPF